MNVLLNHRFSSSAFLSFCVLIVSSSPTLGASKYSILRKNARRIAATFGESVVNVQIVREEGGQRISLASFSGVFLQGEKDLILSCCGDLLSLLESKKNYLEITFEDLQCRKGQLLKKDDRTGICLIRCSGNKHPPKGIDLNPLKVQNSFIPERTNVLTVANPFGIEHSVRYGVVCGPVFGVRGFSCNTFQLSLPAVPGEGGGVVCDFSGKFVGLICPVPGITNGQRVQFVLSSDRWLRVAILPAKAVYKVVNYLKSNRRVLRGWIGAKFSICPEGKKEITKVASVIPGGAAFKAGLVPGDVVCQANNRDISSILDLYRIALWVEYEGLGKDLVLKISRGEKEIRKTITIPVGLRPEQSARDGKERFSDKKADNG